MELKLWGNINKRRNSTKLPWGSYVSMDVVLKDGTSLESPTFILQTSSSILDFNYCQFAGHYYFINDIVIARNNIYELVCQQDVLATYKSDIANYTCYVERSTSNYDTLVEDNYISTMTDVVHTQEREVNLLDQNVQWAYPGRYLLRVAGNGGIITYVLTATELANAISFGFDSSNTGIGDVIESEMVKAVFNPFEYIIDVRYFPFSDSFFISSGDRKQYVKFGWWTTNVEGYVLGRLYNTFSVDINWGDSTTRYYNDFRDFSPRFTNYNLLLPGYGLCSVNGVDVSSGLRVYYTVDFVTGDSDIYVARKDTHAIIFKVSAMLGIPWKIAQTSYNAGRLTSGALSTIGSLVSGNIPQAAGALADVASTLVTPTPSVNGNNGSIASVIAWHSIVLICHWYGSKDIPDTLGRPCYMNKRLGDLSGFIKCGNASIPLAGLGEDTDTINAYLNGGFYYE